MNEKRSEYSDFDRALFDAIARIPEPEYPSVAKEAVSIARARMKRQTLLRWGGVVAVVSLVVAVMGSLRSGFVSFLIDILTAAVGTRPDPAVGRMLLNALATVGDAVRGILFGGALARELEPLMPQIIVSAIGLGLVAVCIMYIMGLWLRKSRRVRS